MTHAERIDRVEREAPALPVAHQCELPALARSTVYCERGSAVSDEDLALMRRLDELHLRCCSWARGGCAMSSRNSVIELTASG